MANNGIVTHIVVDLATERERDPAGGNRIIPTEYFKRQTGLDAARRVLPQ